MRCASRLGLIGQLPHAADVQALLRREEQAEEQRRAESRTRAARSRRRPRHPAARRRTSSRRCGTPREIRRPRRASARRRRAPAARCSRNEPVNGMAKLKRDRDRPDAEAIDSHSGNDQRERDQQPARARGWRRARARTSRRSARSGRRAPTAPPARAASASARDAPDRRRGRTARRARRATTAAGARAGPLHQRERRSGWRRRDRVPKTKTNDASRMSTVTVSSRRSRMMVANAPVALMRFVAREKIRANDLAGARRQHAAGGEPDRRRAKRVAEARAGRAARAGTASAAPGSPGSRTSSPATAPATRAARGRSRPATRQRSTLCRNSASSATASASTTTVRKWDRIVS